MRACVRAPRCQMTCCVRWRIRYRDRQASSVKPGALVSVGCGRVLVLRAEPASLWCHSWLMGVSRFLREALRDVLGPALRAHGYRGTSPTWRKYSADGDVAVINVQSSAFNSVDEGACVVNLGVAPAPWIDREVGAGQLTVAARDGLKADECLWVLRLHAQSSTDPDEELWWDYRDEASAVQVAETIVSALQQNWLSTLDSLLNHHEMRRRLLAEDPGFEQIREDPEEIEAFLRKVDRPPELSR